MAGPRSWCYAQHPLSRPSSFRGVAKSFCSEVMQIVNNLQINGWSWSPKHDPAHFTVSNNFLVWMVWSFSRTFKDMVGPCSARHGPVRFEVLINLFVGMLCSRLKTSKFLAGPRSPTSPVTAQLNSQSWITFSSWCYADCQQRSNQRLVVLLQTRSSSFHGAKAFSRLGGMKVFRRIQSYGWAVLPQARPSSFHSLEELFRPDVMQPFKTIQIYGCAALPNIPCHGPAKFAELNNLFVVKLCRMSTTFNSTAGRASSNTIQLISRC